MSAPPAPDELASTTFLFWKIANAVVKDLEARLEPLGIRTKELTVLASLDAGGPRSQQALAEMLRIDRTTMVAVVDAIERAGWGERQRDPDDRRAYLVRLTPAGRKLARRARRLIAAAEDEIYAPLGADGRRELLELVRTLAGAGHLPGFGAESARR